MSIGGFCFISHFICSSNKNKMVHLFEWNLSFSEYNIKGEVKSFYEKYNTLVIIYSLSSLHLLPNMDQSLMKGSVVLGEK